VRSVFFIDSRPQAGLAMAAGIRLTCGGHALWDRDGGGRAGVAWGGGKGGACGSLGPRIGDGRGGFDGFGMGGGGRFWKGDRCVERQRQMEMACYRSVSVSWPPVRRPRPLFSRKLVAAFFQRWGIIVRIGFSSSRILSLNEIAQSSIGSHISSLRCTVCRRR
jgi:hypothetical protein